MVEVMEQRKHTHTHTLPVSHNIVAGVFCDSDAPRPLLPPLPPVMFWFPFTLSPCRGTNTRCFPARYEHQSVFDMYTWGNPHWEPACLTLRPEEWVLKEPRISIQRASLSSHTATLN